MIPPVKLFKAGVLDEELKRFVLANGRIPDQNWGDINALTAALATAQRRMAMLRPVRRSQIATIIGGLLDYGEARARQFSRRFPTGGTSSPTISKATSSRPIMSA